MAKKIFALLASSLLLFACSDNASDAEILSSSDFQNNDVVAKSEASFATNEGCKQNLLDGLEGESSYALAKSAAKSQVVENVYATGDMDKVEFWVNEDGSATAELEFWASCRYNVVDVWKNLDTLFVEALIRKSFEEVDSITGEPKIVEYEGVVSCICLTDVTVNFSAEYLGARYIELGTELSLIEYKKR